MQKFCIAIFLLNSLQSQQQKMDHAEIHAFQLRNLYAKILQSHFPAKFIKKINNKWIMKKFSISSLTLTNLDAKILQSHFPAKFIKTSTTNR